jgi:hypothetical protein
LALTFAPAIPVPSVLVILPTMREVESKIATALTIDQRPPSVGSLGHGGGPPPLASPIRWLPAGVGNASSLSLNGGPVMVRSVPPSLITTL